MPLLPRFYRLAHLGILLLLLTLTACGGPSLAPVSGPASDDGGEQPRLSQFTDVPIPDDSDMDIEHTLILGNPAQWVGRLSFTTTHKPGEVFDFYRNEMPKFQWEEIAVARAEISVLTFTRPDRVATVQISEGTLRGSRVSLTLSPRDQGGGSAGVTGGGTLPVKPIGVERH